LTGLKTYFQKNKMKPVTHNQKLDTLASYCIKLNDTEDHRGNAESRRESILCGPLWTNHNIVVKTDTLPCVMI
jgi:hypothetical protein